MRAIQVLLITIIGSFFYIVAARALTIEELIREDLQWIAAHSSYRFNENLRLPTIQYVSSRQMQTVYYGKEAVARAQKNVTLLEVIGTFNHETLVMTLFTRFNVRNPWHRAILFHETVHFAQAINGMFETYPCPRASEREAYSLTNEWISETRNPAKPMDKFMIELFSMCPDPIFHPGDGT